MKVPFDAFLHFCFVALVCANKKIKTRDGQSMWILEDGLPPLYNGSLRYDNGKFGLYPTTEPSASESWLPEYFILKNDGFVLDIEAFGKPGLGLYSFIMKWGSQQYCVGYTFHLMNSIILLTIFSGCEETSIPVVMCESTAGRLVFENNLIRFVPKITNTGDLLETLPFPIPKCTQIADGICATEFSVPFQNGTMQLHFEPGRLATKNFREPFVPPKPRPQSPGHAKRRCNQRRSNSATDKSVMNIVIFVLIRCLSILID